jgi:hypothetical protein
MEVMKHGIGFTPLFSLHTRCMVLLFAGLALRHQSQGSSAPQGLSRGLRAVQISVASAAVHFSA